MSSPNPNPEPRRPFQFGLATLLFIVTLGSILCAALAGMLRPPGSDPIGRPFYVLLAAAAPLAVMVALSLARAAYFFWRRRCR